MRRTNSTRTRTRLTFSLPVQPLCPMCNTAVPCLNPVIAMGIVTCGRTECCKTKRAQFTLYTLNESHYDTYFVCIHGLMLYCPHPGALNSVNETVARIRDQFVVQSMNQCRTVNPSS